MNRFVACAIQKVWEYPLAPDELEPGGPLTHWAWSCRCGKHGDSYLTEAKAREKAAAHFDKASQA